MLCNKCKRFHLTRSSLRSLIQSERMLVTIIFWILIPPLIALFLTQCKLTIDYLNQKLPVFQTVLDLFIKDSLYVAIPFEIVTSLPYFVHFSPFNVHSIVAHVIIAMFRLFWTLLVNCTQGTLMVKSMLLFNPNWIEFDTEAHFYGRIMVMFVIDIMPFTTVDDPINTGLYLMTGNEDERLE